MGATVGGGTGDVGVGPGVVLPAPRAEPRRGQGGDRAGIVLSERSLPAVGRSGALMRQIIIRLTDCT
jgi:hypothetical protein